MTKIDKRKNYYLVLDVETANMTNDALTYDIGFAICDKKGNIYEKFSYVVSNIFTEEKEIFGNDELMNTAYYAKKLPIYYKGLETGKFKEVSLFYVRKVIHSLLKKYKCKAVCAYNANFDKSALDNTIRYITKSKVRWFFPYGTEIYCIWHMACQTILRQKTFLRLAHEKGWVSPKGNIRTSAEIAYRYMMNEHEFEEEHTGLADVEIECKIMAKCFAQKKKMETRINRSCWRLPTKEWKAMQTA